MSAYYNEIDPYAAAWLRSLIAAGHLPAGDVDERSIVEVQPDDLREYDECHFFAGIGGWPLALRMAGYTGRPVWTGSCPCQPFSAAGKQQGTSDDRHLWPEFHRLIAERRPAAVFGEQVASKLGREWLAGVFADLESVGYAVAGADLCAASVNAPHIRQRLWWVADAERSEGARLRQNGGPLVSEQKTKGLGLHGGIGGMGNAMQPGLAQRERDSGARREAECAPEGQAAELSSYWSGTTWLPCADGKARRIEPGIAPLAHGVSGRVGRLRGYGNAIVPQVAAAFVRAAL